MARPRVSPGASGRPAPAGGREARATLAAVVASQKKTERLLDLLALLLGASRPLTYAEIREQFDDYGTANPASGIRTFERDKAELLLLGVPLRCIKRSEGEGDGEEDAYVVDRDRYLLPAIQLAADERAALAVTAEVMRAQAGFPYRAELDSALRKIAFDGGPAHAPGDLVLDLEMRATSRRVAVALRLLEGAVRQRKRVAARYRKLGAQADEARTLEPYGLVYRRGAWLLVARSVERDELRTFRVDRFTKVRVGPRPSEPDFERPEVRVDELARRSPWTFEVTPAEQVELVVHPDAAWIADEDFGQGADKQARADGAIVVRFACRNPAYLVRRALVESGNLEVRAPATLRRLVREAAERALSTYDAVERIAPKRAARPKAPPRAAPAPGKRKAGRA